MNLLHPIRLIATLYLLGVPHHYTRPGWFATWHDCAVAGLAMVDHARRVGMGDVGFSCSSEGGRNG